MSDLGLQFRPLEPAEASAILAGVPGEIPWLPGFPTDGDRTVSEWILSGRRQTPSAAAPWGPWQIMLNGSAVGGIGFHERPDEAGTVEIGYGISEAYWRQGIATDAVIWILGVAQGAGVQLVQATCLPDNLGSAGVLRKAGFHRDGVDDDGEDLWVLNVGKVS